MVLFILLLISCPVFGWVGTLIARNQGVSTAAGFWWGFCLGPLGLLIVALLRPNERPPAEPLERRDSFAAPSFSGDTNLSNDAYKIWLASRYNIKKNDVLGSYVCADRLFPTVDAALEHARDEHEAEVREAHDDADRWREMADRRLESGTRAEAEEEERRFTAYAVAAAVLFAVLVVVATTLFSG